MKWSTHVVAFRAPARRATTSGLLATPCYVLLAVAVLDQLPHMLCYMPLTALTVPAAWAMLMEVAVSARLVLLCYVLLEVGGSARLAMLCYVLPDKLVLDRPVCSICYLPLAVALVLVRPVSSICYLLWVGVVLVQQVLSICYLPLGAVVAQQVWSICYSPLGAAALVLPVCSICYLPWEAALGRPVCSICYVLWAVILVRQAFLPCCVPMVLRQPLLVFVLHYEGVLSRILRLLLAVLSSLSLFLVVWSF